MEGSPELDAAAPKPETVAPTSSALDRTQTQEQKKAVLLAVLKTWNEAETLDSFQAALGVLFHTEEKTLNFSDFIQSLRTLGLLNIIPKASIPTPTTHGTQAQILKHLEQMSGSVQVLTQSVQALLQSAQTLAQSTQAMTQRTAFEDGMKWVGYFLNETPEMIGVLESTLHELESTIDQPLDESAERLSLKARIKEHRGQYTKYCEDLNQMSIQKRALEAQYLQRSSMQFSENIPHLPTCNSHDALMSNLGVLFQTIEHLKQKNSEMMARLVLCKQELDATRNRDIASPAFLQEKTSTKNSRSASTSSVASENSFFLAWLFGRAEQEPVLSEQQLTLTAEQQPPPQSRQSRSSSGPSDPMLQYPSFMRNTSTDPNDMTRMESPTNSLSSDEFIRVHKWRDPSDPSTVSETSSNTEDLRVPQISDQRQ